VYSNVDEFNLIGYSALEFDVDKENGVSTSFYLTSLGSINFSWISHKQLVPKDSTIEEEYVASIEVTKEIVWLRKILEDLQEKQVNYTPLLVDNTFEIKLTKNPRYHDQKRHMNTKYHPI
jgi:hypothetical protein